VWFVLAAANVGGKINWMALGAAFFVLSYLV
jgi:hypothetical protein